MDDFLRVIEFFNTTIHSNRPAIQSVIAKKGYKSDGLSASYKFSQSYNYHYKDFYFVSPKE